MEIIYKDNKKKFKKQKQKLLVEVKVFNASVIEQY